MWLHDRPKDFVKHVTDRTNRALDIIEEGEIIHIKEGSFHIRSKITNGDGPSPQYTVSFGVQSDDDMPHCDCPDWESTHRPCKHFLAIFMTNDKWQWSSLPSFYRDSPYFNLDPDVIMQNSASQQNPNNNISNQQIPSSSEISSQRANETETKDDSQSSTARRIRDKLSHIVNLTYLVPADHISRIEHQVDEILSVLQDGAPNSAGLLLEKKMKFKR